MSENQSQDINLKPIFKFLFAIILICVTPFLISKYLKQSNKVEKVINNLGCNKEEIKAEIENYLTNNKKIILNDILNEYYEQYQGNKVTNQINNAIWLYHKILFDQNLPRTNPKSNESENINIALFFSDFDLILPILIELNQVQKDIKANIFFRQIITKNKFSAIIARYGYAVYQENPDLFIAFYISILQNKRESLEFNILEDIIKNLGLDVQKIKQIADNKDTEEIVKKNSELALNLGINQLPAWIMENGKILFGESGLEIIKKL